MRQSFSNIFFSFRWLLIVFYFGLIACLFLLSYKYYHFIFFNVFSQNELNPLIICIGAIGFTQIGHLIMVILLSGYSHFIGVLHTQQQLSNLSWLKKNNFDQLKIAFLLSISSVVSFALLKEFFLIHEQYSVKNLIFFISIYLALVITCFLLGWIKKIRS